MNSWSDSCSPLVSNFVNILRYYGKYILVILYKYSYRKEFSATLSALSESVRGL